VGREKGPAKKKKGEEGGRGGGRALKARWRATTPGLQSEVPETCSGKNEENECGVNYERGKRTPHKSNRDMGTLSGGKTIGKLIGFKSVGGSTEPGERKQTRKRK